MNTYIYIQGNILCHFTCIHCVGLPSDITEEELREYFVRCGVIRIDLHSGKEQIKIYTDD